jgi:hypothetical protein
LRELLALKDKKHAIFSLVGYFSLLYILLSSDYLSLAAVITAALNVISWVLNAWIFIDANGETLVRYI